jgi:hypothetical protein
MSEAVKTDKRYRQNKLFDTYPKSPIGVPPDLKEIIWKDHLQNGGTSKIQHYLNDCLIPEHIRLMKIAEQHMGHQVPMDEIVDAVERNIDIIFEKD